MIKTYPKVLVVSHNPFSDTSNNGKTLSAFFKGWPKDKIAQLYITPLKYDKTICESFYRISDKEVLNSFMHKKNNIPKNETNAITNEKKVKGESIINAIFAKRSSFMYLIRNMMWGIVKLWRKKELNDWLDEFSPDIIFFQSSNVYRIYDMVNYIKNKYGAKLIIETTDDYISPKFSINPFFWLNYMFMTSRYKKSIKNSECVFVIGDMMKNEYSKKFKGNYKVALNSIKLENNVIPYENISNNKIVFTYTGNIGLNRWKVLRKIGLAIYEINKKNNIKAILKIYSINIPSKKILKKLNIENSMEFCGSLTSEELINVRNKSDVLIHVESFDKRSQYITKLSISTKIPEYLLSERCILAIGPKNVASIKYINDNHAGKVISNLKKMNIENGILDLINNKDKRSLYIKNGKALAEKNHSYENNRINIQNEIIRIFEKQEMNNV